MDPEKKFQPRPNISSRTIKLTHSDPIKRLKEFCKQGKYYHQIKWDKFANGFMIECEVFYNLGSYGHNKRRVLTKEVRWVEKDDLLESKRVIAAILLDNLGVGVSDDSENNEEIEEDVSQDFAKAVTGVLNQVSQQLDNEEGDTDPILSMAGGLIKQMTTMMTEENTEDDLEQSENTQEEKRREYEYIPGETTQCKPESWADISQNMSGGKSNESWADMCQNEQLSPFNWGDAVCQESTQKSWADIAAEQ